MIQQRLNGLVMYNIEKDMLPTSILITFLMIFHQEMFEGVSYLRIEASLLMESCGLHHFIFLHILYCTIDVVLQELSIYH
jgi:hypothetical protein